MPRGFCSFQAGQRGREEGGGKEEARRRRGEREKNERRSTEPCPLRFSRPQFRLQRPESFHPIPLHRFQVELFPTTLLAPSQPLDLCDPCSADGVGLKGKDEGGEVGELGVRRYVQRRGGGRGEVQRGQDGGKEGSLKEGEVCLSRWVRYGRVLLFRRGRGRRGGKMSDQLLPAQQFSIRKV